MDNMQEDQPADEAYGGAGAAPEEEAAAGFQICINVTPGGAMTYSVVPSSDEEAGAQGTPVSSVPELLRAVKEMILNHGASPEASDAEFKAGLEEGE